MKHNRRVLSLLLVVCMICALIPAVVTAESYAVTDVKEDQIVSFADKDWYVIHNNADALVLLLATPEETIPYDASGLSNAWNDSDVKDWCASDKVREWFDDMEWNALSDEKVFFLTHSQAVEYLANNAKTTIKADNGWWLRYDGEDVGGNLFAIAVSDAGFVGTPHVATNYGARPAIKIPVSNIASVTKDGGKWILNVVSTSAFAGFSAVIPEENGQTKIVDGNVTITYTGAAVDSTINVVLTDRVGNVLQTYSANAAASGEYVVTLPADLMGWYTLRVYNSLGNASSTVYKSAFNIEDSHGEVVGYEATLKGDVSINFAIDVKDKVKADEDAYVVVTTTSGTKQISVSDLAESEHQNANASLIINVTAPQMNDPISIQVFDGEGNSGAKQTFSIREYAEAIVKGDYADTDKNLAKHMLNYGAMSQIYFGYNIGDLANKNIGTVEQTPVPNNGEAAGVDGTVDEITYYGSSLVMNTKISLRLYFTIEDGADIGDYSFSVGYPVYGGVSPAGKRMYRIEIENIAPNMLANDFSVTVTKGDASTSVSFSPVDYIQRQHHAVTSNSALKNMLQALYNYHLAAVEHTPVA